MKNYTEKTFKAQCEAIYNTKGQTAVFDFVNKFSSDKLKALKVAYEDCNGCETSSPSQDHVCLVCGLFTVSKDAPKGLQSVLLRQSIMTISERFLLDGVVRELEGREIFPHNDENERIFDGSVFEAIAGEQGELEGTPMQRNKKVLQQLAELSELVDTDYVMVTQY